MKPIIQVKSISKRYRIRERLPYYSLRDEIVNTLRNPLKLVKRNNREFIWALKNVSFNAREGEVLGIIGPNGAGKSTLLKILSRITPPTKGEIRLRGRVASLLEVGTGVHPELTGRENIYLSGAILGMRRSEIKKKFDEIVDFSGVEKFIDTPVKHYSSGMQVRLGFSVAAHLEADILLVDEVLAVGDTEFQKKCLGKMDFARREGRTILFVSHNLLSVEKLCKKTILIDRGGIKAFSDTREVLAKYLDSKSIVNSRIVFPPSKGPGNAVVRLLKCSTKSVSGNLKTEFNLNEKIVLEMEILVFDSNVKITPSFHIKNNAGEYIFVSTDLTSEKGEDKKHKKGVYKKRCTIPENLLAPGTYLVGPSVTTISPKKIHFFQPDLILFKITERLTSEEQSSRGNYMGEFPGYIRPVLPWESNFVKSK